MLKYNFVSAADEEDSSFKEEGDDTGSHSAAESNCKYRRRSASLGYHKKIANQGVEVSVVKRRAIFWSITMTRYLRTKMGMPCTFRRL